MERIMEKNNWNEIKNKINSLLGKLNYNINENFIPTYKSPKGDGTTYIIINELGYNYIISERGNEYNRKITRDIDELLYWIFKDIIFELVVKTNKKRQQWFNEEESMLMKINKNWGNLLKEEHKKLLLGKQMENEIDENKNDGIIHL